MASTTTTTTVTSGATTTTTTTTTTTAVVPVTPSPTVPLSDCTSDGIYEIRTYYHKSLTEWNVHPLANNFDPESEYMKWVQRLFELTSVYLDVSFLNCRLLNTKDDIINLSDPTGPVKPNDYEVKNPDSGIHICWGLRWDSMAHAEKVWGKLFAMPTVVEHLGKHPFVRDWNRMESRFMRAIGTPDRFFFKSKLYQLRNYTFDTSKVPFNAENRLKYLNWVRNFMNDKECPLKFASFWIAEPEPISRT